MVYRGDDLDLRTPQTWSPSPADVGAPDLGTQPNGKRGYRTGPLFVDETVLAACNYAYDVAATHRAGEVRLEHLLYALTRIDTAAAVLEARGIKVGAIRRELATIVANDIPVATTNGISQPRRSDELAEVLRSASAQLRGNAPATVDDVLHVLLDPRADWSVSSLLSRFATRPVLIGEPLPPLMRAPVDPRYASGPRYAEPPRAYRAEYTGTPTDALQNSRIDALEQMLRALSQDVSNERNIVAGLVRDLSRDTQAHQDDQGRRQSLLLDRISTLESSLENRNDGDSGAALVGKLETIEAALELRLQEMSQSWGVLSNRLIELEGAVRQSVASKPVAGLSIDDLHRAVDFGPISHRLDVIEEAVLNRDTSPPFEVTNRLDRLEGEINRALAALSANPSRMDALLSGFDRVGLLTDRFDTHSASVTKANIEFGERLGAVERAVTAEIETAAAKHQAYANDLTDVHDALMKLNQNQHTLAGSMDQWRADAAADMATIANRLTALDRDSSQPVETLKALDAHMDTMNRLIIERYHRRNRFWYWLFGTDDWIGASWPSQKAAVEAEKERVRNLPA